MGVADYEYPRDEFDELASRRAIRGTHRRKESNLKWWIALVSILVISPLLGWGIVQWAGARGGSIVTPRPQASASASAEPSASQDSTQSPQDASAANGGESNQAATETPSAQSSQPQEAATPSPASANLASNVLVLNGAGVQGLAAKYKQKLESVGYAKVTVDNYRRSQPSSSTVYYREESDAATAKAIAEEFSIDPSKVVMSAEATGAGNQVVVVLRSDIG